MVRALLVCGALAAAGLCSSAKADLVVNFATSHDFSDYLGSDHTFPGNFDTLDLSGASHPLILALGIPQTGDIGLATFTSGLNSQNAASFDYTTGQTLSLNGSIPQSINQGFHVDINNQDTITFRDSPVLTFNLAGGYTVVFQALALPGMTTGDTITEEAYGTFTLVSVPLPPAAYSGLSALAGIAGIGIIRRRRATCA